MKKLLICTILCELCLLKLGFADNQQYFDNAYQMGKQNQFNFNLNQNSNYTTYSQANNLESNFYNGASSGSAGSEDMYKNANNDNSYLYNQGKQDIANCKSKSDPRCSTLNKYGDNDIQSQIHAYGQGISSKYYISVKPDPADSSCSKVTRKIPINQSTATCISSTNSQNSCVSTININLANFECNPNNGGCNSYQNNPDCKLVKPYVPNECKTWSYTVWYGCTSVSTVTCANGGSLTSPGWCGSGTETRLCNGTDYGSGRGSNPNCIEYSQEQLASYSCKQVSYNDGCKGFK